MDLGPLLDRIEAILVANSIPYEREENRLFVVPISEDGFTVLIFSEGETVSVYCNGWHDDFEDGEEAARFFLFALTNGVRLQVQSRNGEAYKWTLEVLQDEKWSQVSKTGLLIIPFWQRKTEATLQNRVLSTEAAMVL
ncbi:hypothetical protein BH11ARM2_BH11ARM2_21700 [soil metagenome]